MTKLVMLIAVLLSAIPYFSLDEDVSKTSVSAECGCGKKKK